MFHMKQQKLGRGLSVLLGENKSHKQLSIKQDQELVESVSLTRIIAGIYQPRKNFNEEALEDLTNSIREKGVIQPIILRKIDDENNYEIIAGERRFRASKNAGLKKIPAIIKKLNNHEALELALIENIQRDDLSLVEEAVGYKKLIAEFSYTQEQIAKKLGKSRSHVTNLLRLLTLPQSVQNMLNEGEISMGHARAIINSEDPEKLARKISSESLNVRDIENLVRDEKIEKSQSTPTLIRTESKIKFVNNEYLTEIENKLSQLTDMEVKIAFNSFKNNGKMTIKFEDLESLENLIKKLEQ
jgi:ParB family chromosome partitioning protein